jgi:hypothetical protein
MKTKNKKPFVVMDERSKQIAYRVMAVMYLLTIFSMQVIVLYRQFALGQELNDFEDIAIIMTVNSLFLVSALLYFGAIQIRNLKISSIILIYVGLVTIGSMFTWVKYNVIQKAGLSVSQLFDKLIIIVSILGLIMGTWVILSLIGKRRIEKDLE